MSFPIFKKNLLTSSVDISVKEKFNEVKEINEIKEVKVNSNINNVFTNKTNKGTENKKNKNFIRMDKHDGIPPIITENFKQPIDKKFYKTKTEYTDKNKIEINNKEDLIKLLINKQFEYNKIIISIICIIYIICI